MPINGARWSSAKKIKKPNGNTIDQYGNVRDYVGNIMYNIYPQMEPGGGNKKYVKIFE